MRWLTNFYDFSFKWTATARIGINPTKAWLSQLVNFKNAIWRSGHLRRTICNKILFLNLEKCQRNVWNASDCFSTILHESSISLWVAKEIQGRQGVCEGWWEVVWGVRKSIDQNWLAKGLGLGLRLLCWGFRGVQEKIPREETCTLQIGSVAFPPGQWNNPQIHPCHGLFDQDGHQDSSSASL